MIFNYIIRFAVVEIVHGESLVKLKEATYIVSGFLISWVTSSFIDIKNAIYILFLLIPLMGIAHEIFHLIAINILKIKYKFTIKGLYIGFIVNVESKRKYILAASFPQLFTLMMMIFYIFTLNAIILTLILLHIAISIEDIGKCLKYIIS